MSIHEIINGNHSGDIYLMLAFPSQADPEIISQLRHTLIHLRWKRIMQRHPIIFIHFYNELFTREKPHC